MSTDNHWVLVTGGTRGIGSGVVRTLAASGYGVAFTYKASDDAARDLISELHEGGSWCEGYRCDVSQGAEVEELSRALIAKHGAPYAVVNNAGITRDALLMNMGHERWKSLIATNLDSAYHVIHAFVPAMLHNGNGCIVNMSSVTAFKGNVGQVNYAASKAALIGMTRSLAVELGRFNIRVNAVAPGLIATEMADHLNEAQRKKILSHIPLRRLGSINDVASMVAFLLGSGGSYLTGQTFVIDGGLTA